MTDFSSRTSRKKSHYKRRYLISSHALDRFRERVEEEFKHRDDADLTNLLDDRVCHSPDHYQVRDPRAPASITTLYAVQCRHGVYYAVEREGTVVTVLDEEMARNNFGGQWTPVLNAPFAKLRELKIAVAAPPIVKPRLVDPPAPPAAPAVAEGSLEEAAAACARARDVQRQHEEVVAAVLVDLERATAALRRATEATDAAQQRLIDLTVRRT